MISSEQSRLLLSQIRQWAAELGFQQLAVSDIDLTAYRPHLEAWLARNFHGEMDYMERHKDLRLAPDQLHPNTIRVLSVRMDYSFDKEQTLKTSTIETFYSGQFTLSTHLIKLNYFVTPPTDRAL